MSMPRLAVRLATVKALMGQTLAGDAVHDSAIQTIDVMAVGERRPFIVVYTDDGEVETRGGDLTSGQVMFGLTIECAVMALGDAEALGVPDTDARLEIDIDRLERQIKIALRHSKTEWADLWRGLVISATPLRSVRGASAESGTRFAARQLQMTVTSIAEPAYGVPASGEWARFIALLEDDSETAGLAPVIRAEIEGEGDETLAGYRRTFYAGNDLKAMGYSEDPNPPVVGPVDQIVYGHDTYGSDDA